jgi:hypothetical protein
VLAMATIDILYTLDSASLLVKLMMMATNTIIVFLNFLNKTAKIN